jgi:hypothetical protein
MDEQFPSPYIRYCGIPPQEFLTSIFCFSVQQSLFRHLPKSLSNPFIILIINIKMRTSAAIITSFAALAAAAPMHSRGLAAAGLDVPVNVPAVGGLNDAALPNVSPETLQSAIDILTNMLNEQTASKRDISLPVGSDNTVADALQVVPTIENVVSNVGGVLNRRQINVPVVSLNIYPNINLNISPNISPNIDPNIPIVSIHILLE